MAGNDQAATPAPTGRTGDPRFNRLLRLAGTDEGFFMLALHSFTESLICGEYPDFKGYQSFPSVLWNFGEILKSRGRCHPDDLYTLNRIIKEHKATNEVRHNFASASREEMLGAVHNFLRFCSFRGISDPALDSLRRDLDAAWEEKKSPMERSAELRKLRYELFLAQRDQKKLLARLSDYESADQRLAAADAEVQRLAAALEQERARADVKSQRVDALRRDLNAAELEKKKLAGTLAGYGDLALYVEHMNRFSLYTRTRLDYERSLMRLTPDQKAAVDAVKLGHDFLVRGGAGTGKTIVLLHAFSKVLAEKSNELALQGKAQTVLLTYTKTLVKYDRYLAEVLKAWDPSASVQTADSFLLSRLKTLEAKYFVDYKAYEKLAPDRNDTGFLTDEELTVEVEDFLFGNLVTHAEYVEEAIPRRGMRQPLSRPQREKVWAIRDAMAEDMKASGHLSKNFSRLLLIEQMEKDPTDDRLRGCDYIFLDESQDLSAADLKALKLMASRGIIMAGDAGQTIYGVGSPFKRAGVGISGRTRVLRTNFRNTCPITEAAEAYRKLGGDDGEGVTQAFREGPAPELHAASTREELLSMLAGKARLFAGKLGYDPENIAVLTPSKDEIPAIKEALRKESLSAETIMEDKFSFSSQGTVRISTLHSSKGLDFPVVLLYLPSLPARGGIDGKAADTLTRNLIYVAMTRAMDNLGVFTLERPAEKPILDLVETLSKTWGNAERVS